MKELKRGDKVKVYSFPLSRIDFEGDATLVKELTSVNMSGLSYWLVNFDRDDPEDEYQRWINQNEESK